MSTVENYGIYEAAVSMYGTGYILFRFAKPFMEYKKGAVLSGTAYFAVMLTLYLVPVEINTFAAYSIGVLSAFFCHVQD